MTYVLLTDFFGNKPFKQPFTSTVCCNRDNFILAYKLVAQMKSLHKDKKLNLKIMDSLKVAVTNHIHGEKGGKVEDEKNEKDCRELVKRDFALLCAISFTLFSGYSSVLVLQSSINIEDGTGVWSLMATYVGGALFNLFLTPTVIKNSELKRR